MMSIIKRSILVLASLLCMIFIFTACDSGSSKKPTDESTGLFSKEEESILEEIFEGLESESETESETEEGDTLEYELDESGQAYMVVGIGDLRGDVVVPDTYRKKPVTVIACEAFKNCASLKSIVISDSVTVIEDNAFENCKNLTSVIIGNSTASIGEEAFIKCKKMTQVTIPKSVTKIGEKAFSGCEDLETVNYTGTASNWAVIEFCGDWGENATSYPSSNPLVIAKELYISDELLTDAVIENVEYISAGAFCYCESLEKITIGKGVKDIANRAFLACKNLAEIEFNSDSVTKIGFQSFMRCAFTSLNLPASLTEMGELAFQECKNIQNVTTGNSLKNIGDWAFSGCQKMSSITLGTSLETIGEHAFYMCYALKSITFPESLCYIGKEAFHTLTSAEFTTDVDWMLSDHAETILSASDLSDKATAAKYLSNSILQDGYSSYSWEKSSFVFSIQSDGTYAVNGRSNSKNIVIPSKYNGIDVTSINYEAFKYCSSLTSITIPDSVTSINNYAFYGCSSLTSITIPDSVTSIGRYAFSGCTSLESITVAEGNTKYKSDGNCLIEISSNTLILGCKNSVIPNYVTSIGSYAFYSGRTLTSITIPDSVTSIGDCAFRDCTRLTSITIPEGVTSIGYEAFLGCSSLTSITIPDSVTSIGEGAFCYCSSLTSITIPDSVTSIGEGAFYYCSSLTSITIGDSVTSIGTWAFSCCTSLTSITIGDSVTSIGSSAFYGCSSLTSITIGDSVTSIGSYAFYDCRSLESITFNDTSEWYLTKNWDEWQNETGGTQIDVTNASKNAKYFTGAYRDYYWYKR